MGLFAEFFGWELDKINRLPVEQFEAYCEYLEKRTKG